MIGGGVIGLPLLCLLGLYFCAQRVIRIICGIGLLVWVGGTTVMFISHREWVLLVFPFLVVLAWLWIDSLKKFADKI